MSRIAILSTNDDLIVALSDSLAGRGHDVAGFLKRSELSLEFDPFDLIVFDLMLPRLNRLDLLKTLRADRIDRNDSRRYFGFVLHVAHYAGGSYR